MNRRQFLLASGGAASLGLAGCAPKAPVAARGARGIPALPFYDAVPTLVPIRAHADRICPNPPRFQPRYCPAFFNAANTGLGTFATT
jgi:hypothetical protein